MTPQGRAIKQAALDFGNGQTLPFTPCKKGYIPVVDSERKVACPLHNQAREMRLKKDGGTFRLGEIDLMCFWSKGEESFAIHSQTGDLPSLGDDAKTNITCDSNKKIKVES